MEEIFPTLFSKTFFVLSLQLFITWFSGYFTLKKFQQWHSEQVPWLTSTKNERDETDIHIDFNHIKGHFYGILLANIATFLALLFWGQHQSLTIALGLFGIWSVLTGIEMALCLLSVDENLGGKVLGVTASLVLMAFIVGVYTQIDFSVMGTGLFWALIALILFNLARLFMSMPRAVERWVSGIGAGIFTLYLVYDFDRLATKEAAGDKDWHTAIEISISLYLDIINLFLELLDAMSK